MRQSEPTTAERELEILERKIRLIDILVTVAHIAVMTMIFGTR